MNNIRKKYHFVFLTLFSLLGCSEKEKINDNDDNSLYSENKTVTSTAIESTERKPWFCNTKILGLNYEIVNKHATKRMQNPFNEKVEIMQMADFSCIKNINGATRNPPRAGLVIDVPKNKIAKFADLTIDNVFTGLVKRGKGVLYIDNLVIKNFGEDALNIQGSNVFINKLTTKNSKPVRPYDYIKTTEKSDYAFIQKMLKNSQETLTIDEIKNLKWRPSKRKDANGRLVNETAIVDGVERNIWISTEFSHADAGFQAYYIKPSRKTSSTTLRNKSTTFVNFTEIDKVSSELNDLLNVNGSQIPYFQSQKSIMNSFNSFRIFLDSEQSESNDNGFEINASVKKEIPIINTNFYLRIEDGGKLNIKKPSLTLDSKKCGDGQICKCSPDHRFDGTIENITIKNLTINTDIPVVQAIILSEGSNYNRFKIGETSLNVTSAYPYWFVGNTLRNSVIGNANATINCDISKYKNRTETCGIVFKNKEKNKEGYFCYNLPKISCKNYPKVKIGTGLTDKNPCIKETFKPAESGTSNVTLNGVSCQSDLKDAVPLDKVTIKNPRQPHGGKCQSQNSYSIY